MTGSQGRNFNMSSYKRNATDGTIDLPHSNEAAMLASKPQPFNLLGLPADLMDVLGFEHLESLDFFNLRLACRDLYKKTSKAFGRRYFKHMKFMLSPDSLQALEDISKNDELSHYIRHIGIGTERIHSQILNKWDAQNFDEWAQTYRNEYETQLRRQVELDKDGTARRILTGVLSSLPNLQSVGIGGPRMAESQAERVWDEEHMQPWGIEKLLRKLGVVEIHENRPDLRNRVPCRFQMLNNETTHIHIGAPYRAFKTVFNVLQEVGRDLKLDLYLRELLGHHDMPFSLSSSDVQAALPRTRRLTVDFAYYSKSYAPDGLAHLAFDAWLNQLIAQTTSITSFQTTSLRGSWGKYTTNRNHLGYIFHHFASGRYPKLRVLELEHDNVDLDVLLSALTQLSSSLDTISLSGMAITNGPPTPSSRDESEYIQRNKWVEVCDLLRGFDNLKSVTLRNLMEYRGPTVTALNSKAGVFDWGRGTSLHPGGRRRELGEVKILALRGQREILKGLGQVVGDAWSDGMPRDIGGNQYTRLKLRALAVNGKR